MRKINKINLYVNDNDKSREVKKDILATLNDYKFTVTDKDYDLAISIGGDGSFLRMVKANKFNDKILYIGINSGTLGFLQEIDIDKSKDFISRLNNNDFKIEKLNIQEIMITTEKDKYVFYSLNEIVVRNYDFSTIKIPIYVSGEYLENFTGDGILISTSTGSTAYNMSFGGAIIYNTLNTLQITPIAPLNNKVFKSLVNSVVIPENRSIELKMDKNDVFVSIDGVNRVFKGVTSIKTRISRRKIKCLRMNDFHFIKVINNKILEK